jgi:hypothetical protein
MTEKDGIMPQLTKAGVEPEWISSMREHHNSTGSYRREDVHRLIGAPWERVDIVLSAEGSAASCVKR